MKKPFLTPENVMDHQLESGRWGFNKCLDLHMEINSYINHICGNEKFDGGGEYADWLNSLGFSHQTDEGWWNKTAVDIRNIELFAEWWKWDSDFPSEKMEAIKSRIEAAKALSNFKGMSINMLEHHCVVESYLNLDASK